MSHTTQCQRWVPRISETNIRVAQPIRILMQYSSCLFLFELEPQDICVGLPVATHVLVDRHGHAVAGRIAGEGGAVAGLQDRPALGVVRLSRRQTGDAGGPPWPRPGGEQITESISPKPRC